MDSPADSPLQKLEADRRLLLQQLDALDRRIEECRRQEAAAGASAAGAPVAPHAVGELAARRRDLRRAMAAPPPSSGPVPPTIHQVSSAPPPPVATAPRTTPEGAVQAEEPESGDAPESFEMRLGTYWLVRIGIVLVLTGLVFLAKLAYESWILPLGPVGKVGLLYLISAGILGGGMLLRRQYPHLKEYGEVILAGGLAAIYFTTYAAHYFPPLRIIDNPLLAGSLLLAWALFMTLTAERKESETLALIGIGLAYYTSIIHPVAGFTLASNLLLAGAAFLFLIRRQWFRILQVCLVASYVTYAIWHVRHRGFTPSEAEADASGLGLPMFFLTAYWLLFTTAAFIESGAQWGRVSRARFLSFNNTAFYALGALTVYVAVGERLWMFSTGFGVALLLLAHLARRQGDARMALADPCLAQGLIVLTLAILDYFSATALAMTLALQSVALTFLGWRQGRPILKWAALISAGLAVGRTLSQTDPLWAGAILTAIMILGTELAEYCGKSSFEERIQAGWFGFLAALLFVDCTWEHAPALHRPAILMVGTALATATAHWSGRLALPRGGQLPALLAQGLIIFQLGSDPSGAAWPAAVVLVLTIGLLQWWDQFGSRLIEKQLALAFSLLYAAAIPMLVLRCGEAVAPSVNWMIWAGPAALVLSLYGAGVRSPLVVFSAQLLLVVAVTQFYVQVISGSATAWAAISPIASAAAILAGAEYLRIRGAVEGADAQVVRRVLWSYRWLITALGWLWLSSFIPLKERPWSFCLIGFALLLIGATVPSRWSRWTGQILAVSAMLWLWLGIGERWRLYFPDWAAVLFFLSHLHWASRCSIPYSKTEKQAGVAIGIFSLFLILTQWIRHDIGGFYTTLAWTVLGVLLFGVSLFTRDKSYARGALLVLLAALVRVIAVDVWKLDLPLRVTSLTALGMALLGLGFVYNRWQRQIQRWFR